VLTYVSSAAQTGVFCLAHVPFVSYQIVMLDNFGPDQLKADAKTFKERYPHVLVEASGGITAETMSAYMSEDVDIISQGKLTQGYNCLDFSLKIAH